MSSLVNIRSFKTWLRKDTEVRWYLILSITVSLIAFIWLKTRYPHPNFLPDSYSYLDAALKNQSINIWPIGYSKFLRLFSCITPNDLVLVLAQYLLLQTAILYFLLTIRFLLSPGKWVFRVLLALCMANPLTLHLANFVSSDALFAALSLIWITQLLWIFHHPSLKLIGWHAAILLLAFMVRYNALFYPAISVAAIALAHMPMRTKLIGIYSIILPVGIFVLYNVREYQQETEVPQFSAFAGWQMAADALYAYAHAPRDPDLAVPAEFRSLHHIVNQQMDSLAKLPVRPDEELGIYYQWNELSPLKIYESAARTHDSLASGFHTWASLGPLYGAYGRWLVKKHPLSYARYWLWPNIKNYYAPQAEFMAFYNMSNDSLDLSAVQWFHLQDAKLGTSNKRIPFTLVYPTVLAVVNPMFLLMLLVFWLSKGFKRAEKPLSVSLRWISLVWIANMVFSVLASPIVLRYQVFPAILTITFLGLLLEFLYKDQIIGHPSYPTISHTQTV